MPPPSVDGSVGKASAIAAGAMHTLAIAMPAPASARIDVRPRNDRNIVLPHSHDLIPVAILGSSVFDVSQIDAKTLAFGPAGAPPAFPRRTLLRDVNGDGFPDLVSRYWISATGISRGDTQACLRGALLDGTTFEGCDTVKTPPPRRPHSSSRSSDAP